MKQSSKILLVSVAGILVVVVAMVITARTMVGNIISGTSRESGRIELSGTRTSEEFAIEGFERVVTEGAWQVEIIQDDAYGVSITADEEVLPELIVEERAGSLFLDMPGNLPLGGLDVRAEVRMPTLDRIETKGGADVSLVDFDLDTLRIQTEGAVNVEGEDSTIDMLYLEVAGASNVDFRNSNIVNAELAVEGAGNVSLNMAGGRLNGYLGGVGQISYSGEISQESVEVRGLGSVERRGN